MCLLFIAKFSSCLSSKAIIRSWKNTRVMLDCYVNVVVAFTKSFSYCNKIENLVIQWRHYLELLLLACSCHNFQWLSIQLVLFAFARFILIIILKAEKTNAARYYLSMQIYVDRDSSKSKNKISHSIVCHSIHLHFK